MWYRRLLVLVFKSLLGKQCGHAMTQVQSDQLLLLLLLLVCTGAGATTPMSFGSNNHRPAERSSVVTYTFV